MHVGHVWVGVIRRSKVGDREMFLPSIPGVQEERENPSTLPVFTGS